MKKKTIPGIYTITSPSGKVYVGQSWNMSKRWTKHKIDCKSVKNKLYSSFKKYGIEAHRIEVIHGIASECTRH